MGSALAIVMMHGGWRWDAPLGRVSASHFSYLSHPKRKKERRKNESMVENRHTHLDYRGAPHLLSRVYRGRITREVTHHSTHVPERPIGYR
jgi:hypothetical protein